MAHHVNVSVKSRGNLLPHCLSNRPVRLLPAGEAGIVYRGNVYPLYAPNWIDLDDSPYPKDACPEFVPETAPVPYAVTQQPLPLTIGHWNVDQSRSGACLVFDATEAQAEVLTDILASEGLDVLEWGESSRPAGDGKQYGWYAVLGMTGNRDECFAELASLFQSHNIASSQSSSASNADDLHLPPVEGTIDPLFPWASEELPSPGDLPANLSRAEPNEPTPPLNDFRDAQGSEEEAGAKKPSTESSDAERHDRLLTELNLALSKLEMLTNSEESLRTRVAEVTEAKTALERDLESARNRVRALETTNASLAENLEKAHEGNQALAATAATFGQLQESLTLQTEMRHALEQENQQLEDDRVSLSEELNRLRAKSGSGASTRLMNTLRAVLRHAFPRLIIPKESCDSLAHDFSKHRRILDILGQLDNGESLASRPWHSARNIMEITTHINTGKRDNGRVYYRRIPTGRMEVFLHEKRDSKSQDLFVQSIARKELPVDGRDE